MHKVVRPVGLSCDIIDQTFFLEDTSPKQSAINNKGNKRPHVGE
jgi:hypothetical protein